MAKQIEDNKTPDMIGEPKKRGRPATGKALSTAERQRRFRERAASKIWGEGDLKEAIESMPLTALLEQMSYSVRNGHPAIAARIGDELVRRAEVENSARIALPRSALVGLGGVTE